MAPTPGVDQDDISCVICSQLYVSPHIPKQIPCKGSHTVCVRCIQKLKGTNRGYKCPLCLEEWDPPAGGIVNLPTNRAIQDIAEKHKAATFKSRYTETDDSALPDGVYQIVIKTLTDKTITLDVRSTDTITDVKRKLHAKEGIRPENQYLVYRGKPIKDDTPVNRWKTLADLNIYRAAVIHNMHKLKGGSVFVGR